MARKSLIIGGYLLATLLVLGGTVLLVAYGNGYTYSFKTGKLVQRGLLLLDSFPGGAAISLGNKSVGEKTPLRRTLQEGLYDFTLTRTGFHTWKKTIQVVPSRVSQHQYVILVPKQLETTQITTFPAISQSLASRDRRRLAFVVPSSDQAGLWSLDTGNRRQTRLYAPAAPASPEQAETLTIVDWAYDDSRILIRRTVGSDHSLLLVSSNPNDPPISISDTFGVNPDSLSFSPTNRQQLYWYADGGLRRLDVGNASITNLITEKVAGYGPVGDRVLYVSTATTPASLWVMESGGPRKKLAAPVPAGTSVSIYSAAFLGEQPAGVTATDTRSVMLYRDIFGRPTSKPLAILATSSQFNGSGRFVVLQDANQITTYDLQENKSYRLPPLSSQATGLTWFDDYHLLFNHDGMVVLLEYDGNYSHDITITDAQAPTATANTKAVLATSPTPTGSVQIKQVTIRP